MLTSLTKCSITFPGFGKTISTHRTNSQQKQQQHDLDFFFRKGADPSQEGVRSQQLRGRQPLPPSTAPPVGGYLTKTVDFFWFIDHDEEELCQSAAFWMMTLNFLCQMSRGPWLPAAELGTCWDTEGTSQVPDRELYLFSQHWSCSSFPFTPTG